ncbi:MAG: hypothetical protein ACKOCH_09850, partial [Bacteroidota bacterium]
VSIGQGRVYWMMASGDDDDSNLPAIPVYLPLIQKIVSTSINWPPGWNEIAPGEPWVEQRKVFAEGGEKSAQQNVSVQLPDALTREVSLRNEASGALPSGDGETIELG